MAERKAQANATLYERLKEGIELLKQSGDPDYVRLSIAAKAYFLLRQKNAKVTAGELPQLARAFGWAVSEQQILDGLAYLKQLNLAEEVPVDR